MAVSRGVAALAAGLLLPAAAPTPSGTLDVEIIQLRSTKGVLRFCLTTDAKAFPDCKSGKGIAKTVPATSTHVRFEGLAHDTYALAVIHDENNNGKLDTFMGMPREGFGFSRNPGIGFGPPRFTSASFEVVAATNVQQQVKIRYLL
ncbi:MAG: DUF2141 domain-containing protein [Sphingomonas sp.]